MNSFFAFVKDIKIAHSIFALPFAVSGLVLSIPTWPSFGTSLLLLLCMVSARSFAMGMNRYLDGTLDGENPRTKVRSIPQGIIDANGMLYWSLFFALLFITFSFSLNRTAGILSVPLLAILAAYSLSKRFTWLCHLYLGLCLGLAPIGVVVALGGNITPPLLYLMGAICFWTAGFDVLYALQDLAFDKQKNLYSIPVRFGVIPSVWISRCLFLFMLLFLCMTGWTSSRGIVYYLGIGIISMILFYEHWIIRGVLKNPAHLNMGFFRANGWIGVVFYMMLQLDLLTSGVLG